MFDYMPDPPAYVPARAATLQNQPPEQWRNTRIDDLLVDVAFVVAFELPLTPASRTALAAELRSRGYRMTPPG
jgi:hypothetical protein